jgi:hypothetical protein
MARKLLGSVATQKCDVIAAFFAPEVAEEIRRRARLEGVGAGRIISWIVEPAIRSELESQVKAPAQEKPTKEAVLP